MLNDNMQISEIALKHFDEIWWLFDRRLFEFRGSMFLIEPFKRYFPLKLVDRLTEKDAKNSLRKDMEKWGQIEQNEHEKEIVKERELPDGGVSKRTQFKDPEVRWARVFILTSFYNLCCLAAHKKTIAELIFEAYQYCAQDTPPAGSRKAFYKLLGITNSFLLAEWAREIFYKAIANDDRAFFKGVSKSLNEDTMSKRFDTARPWIGTTMLWYLGGKNIFPRKEFMELLRQKKVISGSMKAESFKAMLSNLGLTKDLSVTK